MPLPPIHVQAAIFHYLITYISIMIVPGWGGGGGELCLLPSPHGNPVNTPE